MGFDVVGLGCSALDYLGVVPRCPRLDEKIEMLNFTRQGGGPVATALVALSRLGASTSYVGKVGDDEAGKFILREFEKEGVDTSGVVIEKGASSLVAFCVAEKNTGKRTIFWHRGTCSGLDPRELNKQLILSAKFLHLDGHEIRAAIEAAKWAKAKKIDPVRHVDRTKSNGVKVVLDPDLNLPEMEELVKLTDILIAPSNFARDFTKEEDYSKAAEKLFALGPEVVVITLGEKGCLCRSGKGMFTKPAFRVKVVDTTGAGDVFHGAFVYGLLRGWDLEKTAEFSNAASAIKCTKLGGRAGIPTLKQVEDFLASR